MPVSKVIFAGKSIIDITDSTIAPETMLRGAVAYNANGERVIGIAEQGLVLPKCQIIHVTFLANAWRGNHGNYTQTISAAVTNQDSPFAQVSLSSDFNTANRELYLAGFISRIVTGNGTVTATCIDTESPDIDLAYSLAIVSGVDNASQLAIANANSKQIGIIVPASKWSGTDGTYTQTVKADVHANDIAFVDGIYALTQQHAAVEMDQQLRITDMKIQSGQIILTSFDCDSVGPPNIDLALQLKIFQETE